MSYFITCSTGFIQSVQDYTSLRYYKLLVDTDGDGNLEDITTQISNNQIGGGCQQGRGNIWQVVLKNQGGTYQEGSLAGVKCRIDAKCGDNEYITIFSGFTDRKGVHRQTTYLNDDYVTLTLYDSIHTTAVNRKTNFYNFINYKICNPSLTAESIFHQIAYDMGLTAGQIDVSGTLNYVKDYLPLKGDKTNIQELQSLSEAYLGKLYFNNLNKLRLNSPFMTNYSEPSSEWTFDETNIETLEGDGGDVLCNFVETVYDDYESLDQRVIHKNVSLYNLLYEYNEVEVGAGKYWPGATTEKKVAALNYVDPKSGEEWELAINIQTPTIGLYSEATAYNIECDGGLLTLHSFNGATGVDPSLTVRESNAAQIILKNNTASTVTIRKLEIEGQPLRILSNEYVKYYDSSVSAINRIEKKIDGKYMASEEQAYITCKWWNNFGRSPRKRLIITSNWTPQAQLNAVTTLDLSATSYPPYGLNGTFTVEGFEHTSPNDVMGKARTRFNLLENYAFSATGTPENTRQVFSGAASPEETDSITTDITNKLSYTDAQNGYALGGGTITPTQVTIQKCEPVGVGGILLIWDVQLNLTNLDHYEIQVSSDDVTWYSLEFDGTDFKDTLAATTDVDQAFLVHAKIPFTGDIDNPSGQLLYYRIRRVTKSSVNGDWSTSASATTNTVSPGDIAANSVYANNIIAAQINTLLLRATSAIIVGYYGTGDNTTPDEGDRRAVIEDDEFRLEEYTGGVWSTVKGIMIGGEINGLFASLIGCSGLYHPENPLLNIEHFPNNTYRIFNFENNHEDQYGVDDWDTTSNVAYSTTQKKFGTYSLFATSSALSISTFLTSGQYTSDQSMGFWFYPEDIDTSVIIAQYFYDSGGPGGVNNIQVELLFTPNPSNIGYVRWTVTKGTTTVYADMGTSLFFDKWHYVAWSWDNSENRLYLSFDNNYGYLDNSAAWLSNNFRLNLIAYNNYGGGTGTGTVYLDELAFSPNQFINIDVWVQHYNHDTAWVTDFSAADLILRCAPEGRIRFDTQQTEESCGTLHLLNISDRPADYILSGGAATSWADVDFSSYTPYGVKALLLYGFIDFNGNSVADSVYGKLRPDGSSETDAQRVVVVQLNRTNLPSGNNMGSSMLIITPCSKDGIVNYEMSAAQGTLTLTIWGYYI